jgi:hypothetical protein
VKLKDDIDKATASEKVEPVRLSPKFKKLKEQILCVEMILEEKPDLEILDRQELINHISESGMDGLDSALTDKDSSTERKGWGLKLGWLFSEERSPRQAQVRDRAAAVTDSQFLAHLNDMLVKEPLLQDIITRAVESAHDSLQGTVKKLLDRFTGRAALLQQDTLKTQIQRKTAATLEDQRRVSRLQLIEEYEQGLPESSYVGTRLIVFIRISRDLNSSQTLVFEGIDRKQSYIYGNSEFAPLFLQLV